MSGRDELLAAAARLRRQPHLVGYSAAVPLALWLEATAERVGGKSWSGSRQALVVARLINENMAYDPAMTP